MASYGEINRRQHIFSYNNSSNPSFHQIYNYALSAGALGQTDPFDTWEPIKVCRIMFQAIGPIYQTAGATTNLVISLYGVLPGGAYSDAASVKLGYITIPNTYTSTATLAAGKMLICDIDPVVVSAGKQIIGVVTAAYGGSGGSGSFKVGFGYDNAPEVMANETQVTDVTTYSYNAGSGSPSYYPTYPTD
jgi:hypothetical protein